MNGRTRTLVIALAALAATSCKRDVTVAKPAATTNRAPLRVDSALVRDGRIKLATAQRRAPASELRVAGEIRSDALGLAEVGALVSGRVAKLDVAEGESVKRGQPLAWIDAPEVGRATADVLRSRARAVVASRKLERQLELESQDATSRNAVDDARAEEQASRADLLAARTLLSSLGGQEPALGSEASAVSVNARVAVRSPIDGVVSQREAMLGGAVSPEKMLFRIVAPGHSLAIARIPETTAPPLDGTRATLRMRGDAATSCDAKVSGSVGVVDTVTRTLALRLDPAPTCTWLTPGSYVDVVFAAPDAIGDRSIVIPREATIDLRGGPIAFVETNVPGAFVPRAVQILDHGGPDVIVVSGVDEGERVVTSGALLLKGELLRAELEGI